MGPGPARLAAELRWLPWPEPADDSLESILRRAKINQLTGVHMRSEHSVPRLRSLANELRARADQMATELEELRKQAADYDDLCDKLEASGPADPLPVEKATAGAMANGNLLGSQLNGQHGPMGELTSR